ncbi:TPA: hypothetical protein DDZ10_03375 [Candidatus Uhrbacteria bacterium]|nr:MAG: hypothetical protein A3D69_01205 [Candidatus Uhrbacteria bacterium RIFCSPHIGHO2_02_FULL_54_11]HBL39684.1 hypothetical protein [Candidatus Uhrbacteria bacterium]
MTLEDEIRQIVLARLETLPEDTGMSIGFAGELNKQELISHVKNGDMIGQTIIDAEMQFLQALKTGVFYE